MQYSWHAVHPVGCWGKANIWPFKILEPEDSIAKDNKVLQWSMELSFTLRILILLWHSLSIFGSNSQKWQAEK